MKRPITRTAMGLLAVLAAGCATYPMGMTREQWDALPAEKQAEYRAEQYRIDEARRQQAAAERAERQRRLEEAQRAEQARIAALYQQARYRDVVTVTIPRGHLVKGDKRYRLQPVSFDLIRGEAKSVQLVGVAGNFNYVEEVVARFSPDGNTVVLNEGGLNQEILTLVNTGWDRGATTPIGSFRLPFNARLTDSALHIRFKPLPGEPERVILEQR
jgi:transcription elongation GreA/GreB family factor